MTFFSLNTFIDDILLEYRDSKISESEDLSRIQIEQWIHSYRAKLFREELNKGYDVDPEYIQEIGLLHLTKQCDIYNPNTCIRKSDEEIPSFLSLHNGTGLMWVKDSGGNLIQIGNQTKAKYQTSRKYTCQDYIAWQDGKYLMLDGPCNLEYVTIA